MDFSWASLSLWTVCRGATLLCSTPDCRSIRHQNAISISIIPRRLTFTFSANTQFSSAIQFIFGCTGHLLRRCGCCHSALFERPLIDFFCKRIHSCSRFGIREASMRVRIKSGLRLRSELAVRLDMGALIDKSALESPKLSLRIRREVRTVSDTCGRRLAEEVLIMPFSIRLCRRSAECPIGSLLRSLYMSRLVDIGLRAFVHLVDVSHRLWSS